MDALQAAEDATAPVQAKTEPKAAAPPKPIKEPPKKKRKTPSPSIPIPVFDLEEPTYVPPKSRAPPRISVSAGEDVFRDAVIASQKPMFKPGAGDSMWYGGERTGVSTAVKSVRF